MRIAFFVNETLQELAGYTTTRLAQTATNGGHEVWYIGASDFAYSADGQVHAYARKAPKRRYDTHEAYLADLIGPRGMTEHMSVSDLDVLMLRSDPSTDTGHRAWAQTAGITFGASGGGGAQRSQWSAEGHEQDVFSAVSGGGPAQDPHFPESG